MTIFASAPPPVLFVTGIDTGVGKTVVTGLLARFLQDRGLRVATQKPVQTGDNRLPGEDLRWHRRLMGVESLPEDAEGITCPYRFQLPASPHLAAGQEDAEIDPPVLDVATERLRQRYDVVLVEGAGGLLVPLRRDLTLGDYLVARLEKWGGKLVVVTTGRLGSINQTLLTLEAAASRNLPLAGLVVNHFVPAEPLLCRDAVSLFRDALDRYGRPGALVEMSTTDLTAPPIPDFSPLWAS